MRAIPLLLPLMLVTLGLSVPPTPASAQPPSPSLLGFDWGNAPLVYVLHRSERGVPADDPSLAFRTARANNVTLVRTWAGLEGVVIRWRSDRNGTLADLRRMLDDARANGVRLILSNRLDLGTIEALAGRSYPDWGSAQRDLVTPGSPAWEGFMAWLRDLVGTLGAHPAAYSWEAVNEPGWMLGLDAGHVTGDQAAHWLNAFQGALHGFGARRVNMGGATFASMTDAQLLLATQYTDILDDHFYPDYDAGGKPVDGNEGELLARFEAHIRRVENLSGRSRPAMVGEYGTLPWAWFTSMAQALQARGWNALAWEYDGWDQFWFNATYRPEVLAYLRSSNPPPPGPLALAVAASPRAGPAPLGARFNASPTGGWPPYAYAWTFGDGSSSGLQSPTHGYTSPGLYGVRVVVRDGEGGEANATVTILVVPPLVVHLAISPSRGSAAATFDLTATASGGMPPYRFLWDLGDGSQALLQNLSHTYPAPGGYHVRVAVTDSLGSHGGWDEAAAAEAELEVLPGLAAVASADRSWGVAPLGVRFSASAWGGLPPYAYAWTFGDGGTATGPSPAHEYEAAGSYTAMLTITDASGATAARALAISVVEPLEVALVADRAAGAAPLAVRFAPVVRGGSGAYTYRWDFGDGQGSRERAPLHIYPSPGTYTVDLEVEDGGQSLRRAMMVRVAPGVAPLPSPPLGLVAAGAGAAGASLALAWGARRRRAGRGPRRRRGA